MGEDAHSYVSLSKSHVLRRKSAENDEMEYFCVCGDTLANLYVPQKIHTQVSVTFILYMGQIV
jgi:hypothetical protein